MVNEIFNLIPPFIEGVVLGIIFFVGLWWTVKKGVSAKQPAFLFLVSFFLRIGIVLAGFYFAADGHWDHLLTSLFGFIIVRYIATRLAGPPVARQIFSAKEAEDAP
jgi:F1F0 ATPase subunit 2